MKTAVARTSVSIFILTVLVMLVGCARGQPKSNFNLNVNTNANTNANVASLNANTAPAPSTLAAREPDRYTATLVFSAETEGGEKTIGIPPLSAQVAKNGADRRLAFKLPDGSDLIYLDHNGVPYAIAPARKQYAELTPEATGFQLPQVITPGQLVPVPQWPQGNQVCYEKPPNCRTALKYSYQR